MGRLWKEAEGSCLFFPFGLPQQADPRIIVVFHLLCQRLRFLLLRFAHLSRVMEPGLRIVVLFTHRRRVEILIEHSADSGLAPTTVLEMHTAAREGEGLDLFLGLNAALLPTSGALDDERGLLAHFGLLLLGELLEALNPIQSLLVDKLPGLLRPGGSLDFERGILSGLLLGLDNILPMKRGFALGVRDWG